MALDHFEDLMRKVLCEDNIDANLIASYFWPRMNEDYKRKYRIVASDECNLNNTSAIKLFVQVFQLRKLLPFSAEFVKELWENAKSDFRLSWAAVPEEEITILTNLFSTRLSLN